MTFPRHENHNFNILWHFQFYGLNFSHHKFSSSCLYGPSCPSTQQLRIVNFESEPRKLQKYLIKPPFRTSVSSRHPKSSGPLCWLLFPLHLLLGFGQACKWQMDSAGPRGPDAPCLIHEGRSLAVTLHMKGQALAWAKLPRLSSVTFPLYALVCSHSARAPSNKSNGLVGWEEALLLYSMSMFSRDTSAVCAVVCAVVCFGMDGWLRRVFAYRA